VQRINTVVDKLVVTEWDGRIKERKWRQCVGVAPQHELGVYNNSLRSCYRALSERFFNVEIDGEFEPPLVPAAGSYDSKYLKQFNRLISNVVLHHSRVNDFFCNQNEGGFIKQTMQQVVDSYKGAKKKIYQRAMLSLISDPINEKDFVVKFFVKFEKQNLVKAPRGIFPMSARYNLLLACYLKHLEHHIYRAIGVIMKGPTVMKGFNAQQTAEHLKAHWDSFNNPCAISIDAKKFDMHVSLEALNYEFSLYKKIYHNDRFLTFLLSKQLNPRGYSLSPDGMIHFSRSGGRLSGVINTALGNCFISVAQAYALGKQLRVKIRVVNNGDDTVIFCEKRDMVKIVDAIPQFYAGLGFRMSIDGITSVFEQIVFCQSQPVQTPLGWRMCRNPTTCFIKDSMCISQIHNSKMMRKWFTAVGQGGMALFGDMPILSSFYKMYDCKEKIDETDMQRLYKNTSFFAMSHNLSIGSNVDLSTRQSFERAFGISSVKQLAIEKYLGDFQVSDIELTPAIISEHKLSDITNNEVINELLRNTNNE